MKAPRTGSTILVVAGLTMLMLAAAAIGHLFVLDRARAMAQARNHHALLSRLFEDNAVREVDAASQALASLAQMLAWTAVRPDEAASAQLTRILTAHRGVRELAIIDLDGRILASSQGGSGRRVDTAPLRPLPAEGRDALGPWTPGRFVGDAPVPDLPGVGHLPVLRTALVGGEPVLLVATLDPDSLALAMRLALGEHGTVAALLSLEGQVLAHTGAVEPGSLRGDRAPVRAAAAQAPGAGFIGEGLEGDEKVGAWRAAAAWPMTVVVETPMADITATWWQHMRSHAVVAMLALALMAAALGSAWRMLRVRERARQRRDFDHGRLRQRERELHGLVGHLQTLLFRTDDMGRVGYLNAHWGALLGDRAADLRGQPLASAFADGDRAALAQLFEHPAAGRVRTVRATLADVSGQPRRYDLSVVPMLESDGVVGFAGCAVEVTGQEQEQERLQDELAFHAKLIELSPLPVSLLDDRSHYVQVNRAWEAFTGRSRAEWLGRAAGEPLVGAEAERHSMADQRLRLEGGTTRYESPYTLPDGSQRTLIVSKARLPGDGARSPLILCMVTDVSEVRAAEAAALQARDRADEARQAMVDLTDELDALLDPGATGAARGDRDRMIDLACLVRLHLDSGSATAGTDLAALVRGMKLESPLDALDLVVQLPSGEVRVPAPEPALRRILRRLFAAIQPRGQGLLVLDLRRSTDGAVGLSLGTGENAASRGSSDPPPRNPGLASAHRLARAVGAVVLEERMADGGLRILLQWPAVSAAR